MFKNAWIIVALLMVSASAFAQNILVNPGFDVSDQLTDWTCTSTHGLASWDSEDRQGSADSGSMEHNVTADSDNGLLSCTQCLPVQELWSYVLSGWFFWPNDPDVSQQGSPRISFNFFENVDCSGGVFYGPLAMEFPTYDTWRPIQTTESIAPAGSQSALVYFITWQDLADQWVRARYDDLDFSATTLFRDGFESGSLDAWIN